MRRSLSAEPWKVLDEYRGKYFEGQWPSLPVLFKIMSLRNSERECWEAFSPEHILLNYRQAQEKIEAVASELAYLGVKKGDKIGLTGKNSPEWTTSYLGIQSVGAVVVPVDYSLSDEDIERFFDFVEVKGVFIDGERFERIGKDNKYGFKFSLERKNHEDTYVFNINDRHLKYEYPTEDDLAALLFTSGTTGTPKAVCLTHKNFVSDSFSAQVCMNTLPSDVYYAILPIHHAYTMQGAFIVSYSQGGKTVFGKRLSINQIFKEIRLGKVNMFLGVPMIFNKLLAGIMKGIDEKGPFVSGIIHGLMEFSGFVKKVTNINIGKFLFRPILKKVSLENNRMCISGGGPLPVETAHTFNKLGIYFVQGYGLTESGPILTLNCIYDYEDSSIGKPVYSSEFKFINKDENGNGEICVRGPMVMQGYYNNPEATAEVIDEEGFLHTGDVGYQDEKGFVYLTGRAKNVIVTEGGKNVFPEEIEDHFQLYDDIEQICVVSYTVDAEKKSEGICALVYPSEKCYKTFEKREDLENQINSIIEKVNRELISYKRIRKVVIIDERMEESSTKKIKRFVVKKKYSDLIG